MLLSILFVQCFIEINVDGFYIKINNLNLNMVILADKLVIVNYQSYVL